MDFVNRMRELANRAEKQLPHCETEEATKNALILPFISALGYDIFNPTEVLPEFTADVGIKKGEKVDYAILKEKAPLIIFECKRAGTDLSQVHASQLYRYFASRPRSPLWHPHKWHQLPLLLRPGRAQPNGRQAVF